MWASLLLCVYCLGEPEIVEIRKELLAQKPSYGLIFRLNFISNSRVIWGSSICVFDEWLAHIWLVAAFYVCHLLHRTLGYRVSMWRLYDAIILSRFHAHFGSRFSFFFHHVAVAWPGLALLPRVLNTKTLECWGANSKDLETEPQQHQ